MAFKSTWTLNGGKVAAYDFTQKPSRQYAVVTGPQEVIGLLDYHEDSFEYDMLCVRCFWRGDMRLTSYYPSGQICCPSCQIEGGMVRG